MKKEVYTFILKCRLQELLVVRYQVIIIRCQKIGFDWLIGLAYVGRRYQKMAVLFELNIM